MKCCLSISSPPKLMEYSIIYCFLSHTHTLSLSLSLSLCLSLSLSLLPVDSADIIECLIRQRLLIRCQYPIRRRSHTKQKHDSLSLTPSLLLSLSLSLSLSLFLLSLSLPAHQYRRSFVFLSRGRVEISHTLCPGTPPAEWTYTTQRLRRGKCERGRRRAKGKNGGKRKRE
jgi:hypothetical protein